jgi:flavin-dependent thymidylate synthase
MKMEDSVGVRLLTYTGQHHHIPDFAARLLCYIKATRLGQGDDIWEQFMSKPMEELKEDLTYASRTIRSSWEMVDFTFRISGVTRAFTHQLVRTRTASFAQEAQRVADLRDRFNVTMPDTVEEDHDAAEGWEYILAAIEDYYNSCLENGIPAQDARGILPTNFQTSIVVKLNLRTLADLVGKRQNARAQGEYAHVVRLMTVLVLEKMPWANEFLYPERLQTPELDALIARELGKAGPLDKPHLNEAMKELDLLKGIWG